MEVTIVNFQFFSGTAKTTVSLLSIAVIGLFSPLAIAQEELPIVESEVERLEEITIPQGTVQEIEVIEHVNSSNYSFAVGNVLRDDAENETFYLQLDSEQKYILFGRELNIYPHFENWLNLNHGEGPRGYVSLPIILF